MNSTFPSLLCLFGGMFSLQLTSYVAYKRLLIVTQDDIVFTCLKLGWNSVKFIAFRRASTPSLSKPLRARLLTTSIAGGGLGGGCFLTVGSVEEGSL